jgi:anti-anti-sigma regulatory factor
VLDALARLQLALRRAGCELRLVDPDPGLAELVRLAGLAETLGLEPRRQPEEREQRLGVEEERELGDAAG